RPRSSARPVPAATGPRTLRGCCRPGRRTSWLAPRCLGSGSVMGRSDHATRLRHHVHVRPMRRRCGSRAGDPAPACLDPAGCSDSFVETTTKESSDMPVRTTNKNRWLALIIVCLGYLMIVLDVTIVGVALPSIREDLGFSPSSLAWVANVYMLTFGGFLLLAGRLGDLFGHRRLFLTGIALFTLASLGAGLAAAQAPLVGFRAVPGLAGAIASAAALSLIVTLFTEPAERAKAMGVFGFVAAGGGTIGVLLGGILTDALSWHWIFLVNVPIGAAVLVLARLVLPGAQDAPAS